MDPPSDGDLRYRYLDWCSAKVAERFQQLSSDEIWERAQSAGRPPLPLSSAPADLPVSEHPGYLELVRLLSVQLADELGLPSFRQWCEAYRRDPEPFDREMIGFGSRRTAQGPLL